ncbi:pyridoxal-phosphate dependent enzyme [Fodinibius halophilus]|uniref:Pyridoxal-phosphate dependent enzyme n=1 Tax=Fodinibius halophilus TaxID=1736908 RepID=A0A6M1TNR3_9BACT|nr:pyridoxal-phosphate dependent enzyme [Fodinibius halophilus]NGP89970.1 pyridoxal-phosphate dependent enzyme [Fodinibius halophilus]
MARTTKNYQLKCVANGHLNSEEETTTYCTECGSVLRVYYDEPADGLRYPLDSLVPDPLKSNHSALTHLGRLSKTYNADLYAKLDFEHPTGCFKDRGSYIEVQKALELEADAICVASTGNMAASVAAYACYFKIPCFIFVPEKTTDAKIAQATIYDANIIRIKGDFSVCEGLCRKFAESGNYYMAGDYVFREEGQKAFPYEIQEQHDGEFDYIFIPIGCGTNFAAIHKGYQELKEAGRVSKIPKLIALQPEQSSPVVEGIFKKKKIIKKQVNTMAQSVAASDPVDFEKVLIGIQDTDGAAYTVTEDEILQSLKEMAVEEGHFTEPACALPLAAFKNNLDTFKGKKCLFILTGAGLKDTKTVAKHSLSSPVLSPDIDKIRNYIESGYIEMQKESWGKSRDTFMANLEMDEGHQELYNDYVSDFNKKGKTLSNNEIEVLQSLVFNEDVDLDYPAEVLDYKLTMRKHGLVQAKVKLDIEGKEVITEASGVGPIDAILSAMKSETDNIFLLQVSNHEVEILSPDTDSLVMVTLTLTNDGKEWVSKGASPDTLEAVIQAFTKGLAIATKGAPA